MDEENWKVRIKKIKFKTSNSESLIKENDKIYETEWFYITQIKKIEFKNKVLKIISCGCFNDLINKRTIEQTKDLWNKLNKLKKINKEEMLKENQIIEKAEIIITKNSKKYSNILINKTIINDEVIDDT